MKKQYTHPAFAVIALKQTDILTTSPNALYYEVSESEALSPDRFYDWE